MQRMLFSFSWALMCCCCYGHSFSTLAPPVAVDAHEVDREARRFWCAPLTARWALSKSSTTDETEHLMRGEGREQMKEGGRRDGWGDCPNMWSCLYIRRPCARLEWFLPSSSTRHTPVCHIHTHTMIYSSMPMSSSCQMAAQCASHAPTSVSQGCLRDVPKGDGRWSRRDVVFGVFIYCEVMSTDKEKKNSCIRD